MVGKRKAEPDVTVRVPAELGRRADAYARRNNKGLESRNEVASYALSWFLDEMEQQEMRREAFQAWVTGGRKGTPPWVG